MLTPILAKSIPTASEIHQALPAEGMMIKHLIDKFKGRVDKTTTPMFIRLVKAVSTFDKQRSWITPLPQLPPNEQIQAAMRKGEGKKPAAAASPS
jgi:transcription initiation factor TFIIF subunit alpha